MQPGQELIFRVTGERVRVVTVVDASGTLLVSNADAVEFQAAPDEVIYPWERDGCGCCG